MGRAKSHRRFWFLRHRGLCSSRVGLTLLYHPRYAPQLKPEHQAHLEQPREEGHSCHGSPVLRLLHRLSCLRVQIQEAGRCRQSCW